MFNNREENWINYIARLGEPYDGVELAKVAERLGVGVDDVGEFVEAAMKQLATMETEIDQKLKASKGNTSVQIHMKEDADIAKWNEIARRYMNVGWHVEHVKSRSIGGPDHMTIKHPSYSTQWTAD